MNRIKAVLLSLIVISMFTGCSAQRNHDNTVENEKSSSVTHTTAPRATSSADRDDGRIGDDMEDTENGAGNAVKNAEDGIGNAVEDAGRGVGKAAEGIGEGAENVIEGAGDAIGDVFDGGDDNNNGNNQ